MREVVQRNSMSSLHASQPGSAQCCWHRTLPGQHIMPCLCQPDMPHVVLLLLQIHRVQLVPQIPSSSSSNKNRMSILPPGSAGTQCKPQHLSSRTRSTEVARTS